VDSTAGCETLCFLDAYSGYHQIRMKESDQLATSFITPFGMYCYVTVSFDLRNAGATYQRCMNHVFGEHIGRTVEAYVDDIVVKTRKASDLLSDLEATFRCLKAKGVKLNPKKCVFGVPRGMLLGFIISERGIEANPEKIAAITEGHGMSRGSEPLHLAPWRKRSASVPPLKEGRVLRLDPRGRGSPREPEGAPHERAHLGAPRCRRSPLDLRRCNHPGG
jgi:hypothetical protein